MKKKSVLFTCILLAVTMIMVLCGCSTYGSVKKAFEKEGYTENSDFEAYQAQVVEALGEDFKDVCSVHLMTVEGTLKYALILEFKSTKEMEEQINESENLKEKIKDVQKSDLVSGNCVLLSYNLLTNALDIFKSTK